MNLSRALLACLRSPASRTGAGGGGQRSGPVSSPGAARRSPPRPGRRGEGVGLQGPVSFISESRPRPPPPPPPRKPRWLPGAGDPRPGRVPVRLPRRPAGSPAPGPPRLVLPRGEPRAPPGGLRALPAAVPGLDVPFPGPGKASTQPGAASEGRDRAGPGGPRCPSPGRGGLCAGAADPPALSKHSCGRAGGGIAGAGGERLLLVPPPSPRPPRLSDISPALYPGISLSRGGFTGGSAAPGRGGSQGTRVRDTKLPTSSRRGDTPLPPLILRASPCVVITSPWQLRQSLLCRNNNRKVFNIFKCD